MAGETIRGAGLERMLDEVPTRIWLLDADHRVLWCNARAAELLGCAPQALVGLSLAKTFGFCAMPDLDARAAALAGEDASWRGWADYADGVRRYTERRFTPYRDETGRLVGYLEFTSDQTELMAARDAAARAETRLADAIASLPDGLAVENPDGRLAVCNGVYAGVYGLPAERLVGMDFEERMRVMRSRLAIVEGTPMEADPETAQGRLRRLRRDSLDPIEAKHVDGRELVIQRAPTAEGGRVVLMTDITALRAREREASEARVLLEDAVEAVALGFAIFDAGGALSLCNRTFVETMGEDAARLGATWPDILAASAEAGRFLPGEGETARCLSKRIDARLRCSCEERLPHADGRLFAAARSETRGGGVVITLRDITETARNEAVLRDSWETVRSVLEACPTPITMARLRDGHIVYVNPAAREMMRTPEVGGSTLTQWRSLEDRAAFIERLQRDGRVDAFENCFRRGDGADIWLAIWSRLAEFRGEQVIVTAATDLAERRAREAERARQREVLHQAEKLGALGEVLAGVSHELNNPLSVLVGQAAILLETAPDAAVRRRAERMAEASARCARIVKSFLAMARQQPAAFGRLDLAAIAREALAAAGPEIEAAGASVTLDLPEGGAPTAGDREQLRQVIVNLLTNAAQAMADRPGPRRIALALRLDAEAGLARLSVADTGPGVPERIASRIFEPLFTTKAGKGSGIGLALCHRLVTAHGGAIALDQAYRDGARFVVELPLAPMAGGETAMAAPAPRSDARTVLVVDDDEEVLRTTAELIEMDGHRALLARSATEALRLLAGDAPDIVFSDVRMPDIDGLELYGLMVARRPELAERVIFATGDALRPDVARAIAEIGRPCLEKPFLPEDIRAILAHAAPHPGGRRSRGSTP